MDAPGWLSRRLAEVPAGDAWLGHHERRVLQGLRLERRRNDWRLGRWTAKAAVGAWLGLPPENIEIIAAADGAPEAWCEGAPIPVSVSVSHRGGRAVAAVSSPPLVVGCDLELIEPRSDAFLREWLAGSEQELIAGSPEEARPLLANLIWTAKEASAKVRREGLRLNVRQATVNPASGGPGDGWRPVEVRWAEDGGTTQGWWRCEPGWVLVIAGHPLPARPRAIITPAR